MEKFDVISKHRALVTNRVFVFECQFTINGRDDIFGSQVTSTH